MSETRPYKVAIVWRGDRDARINATPQNNRFHRIFEELMALGIQAEPAVYDESFADTLLHGSDRNPLESATCGD